MKEPADLPPRPDSHASRLPSRPRAAARDGLWVLGAKVYFILSGLIQQVMLGRVLGLEGYGALATALSASSIAHNTIVQASLQGVSRTVARTSGEPRQALRRVLIDHSLLAVGFGGIFFLLAGPLARALGAPHVQGSLEILSIVFAFYGLYAPFIGALNGTGRIRIQAAFDVLSATLRTVGMVGGALLGPRVFGPAFGPLGAVAGFACAAAVVLVLSAGVVGLGARGGREPERRAYALELGSLMGGQLVLNLLFQADALLLRRIAATAALHAGQAVEDADAYVGAYRAAQLFGFLPYQLLASVTVVLFPLLARAQAESDASRVGTYVQNGVRIALLVLGILLSVLVSMPTELIDLVYGAKAAALGGSTLRILALSLGLLAVLGVLTTCLNSLGHAKKTFLLTLVALVSVVAFGTLSTWGLPLHRNLLERMALGTGAGLLIAVLLLARELIRAAGPLVRLKSLRNITFAALLATAAGSWLFGAFPVLLRAPLVVGVNLGLLFLIRELTLGELKSLALGRSR